MIDDVTEERSEFAIGESRRFEAGTPNMAGVLGLGAAIAYLEEKGMENIELHGRELFEKSWERLSALEGVELLGKKEKRIPVIAFSVTGVPPHDVADILAREDVCIRAGKHCTHPLHARLSLREGSCRISFGLSNNVEDINRLVAGLEKVRGIFS